MDDETIVTPQDSESVDLSPVLQAVERIEVENQKNQEEITTSLDGINSALWDIFDSFDDSSDDVEEVTNQEILDAVTLLFPDEDALGEVSVSNQEILDAVNSLSVDFQSLYSSIYAGTISSSYVDLFDRLSYKFGYFDDYILYRSGQYEYTCCWGDLDLESTTFTGDALHSVRLRVNTTGSAGYVWSDSDGDTLNLNVGTQLVYSNLGDYPTLHRETNFPLFVLIFILSVFFLCCFVRPWFNFTLRSGSVSDGGATDDTETV